jgi:hypothetical protein
LFIAILSEIYARIQEDNEELWQRYITTLMIADINVCFINVSIFHISLCFQKDARFLGPDTSLRVERPQPATDMVAYDDNEMDELAGTSIFALT